VRLVFAGGLPPAEFVGSGLDGKVASERRDGDRVDVVAEVDEGGV
jgi:hypothetical protein